MSAYSHKVSLEFPQEIVEWMVIWHCFLDACPKCQALNGFPFHGIGNLPNYLVHPQFGAVWDTTNDQSLIHPNCRCDVEAYVYVHLDKIPFILEFQQGLEKLPELGTEMIYDMAKLSELNMELDRFNEKLDLMNTRLTDVTRSVRWYIALANQAGLPENIKESLGIISFAPSVAIRARHAVDLFTTGGLVGTFAGAAGIGMTALGAWSLIERIAYTGTTEEIFRRASIVTGIKKPSIYDMARGK